MREAIDPREVRALASAVIVQAWQDMCAPGHDPDRHVVRAEAILFLTAPSGAYAESRFAWCDLADANPGALRSAALAAIELIRAGGKPLRRLSQFPDQPTRADKDEDE